MAVEIGMAEESLVKALNFCMIGELPEPLSKDETRIWVKGVAKVRKVDNSENWVVVENDGSGKPHILRDVGGHMASIVEIKEVHPATWLDMDMLPNLKKKTDAVRYLSLHGIEEDSVKALLNEKDKPESQIKKDKGQVMNMIVRCALDDFEMRKESEKLNQEAKDGEEGTEE